jgi:REP element-mobilizing transposase RayT
MRVKQLKLFELQQAERKFGGQLLVGKRKSQRPLSVKLPIHLVMRSNHPSCEVALKYHCKSNRTILESLAKKYHIKIYQYVYNHTHVHILMTISSRDTYVKFIRVLGARLTRLAKIKKTKLFELRPFTRILNWGREFGNLKRYISYNVAEAMLFTRVDPREFADFD